MDMKIFTRLFSSTEAYMIYFVIALYKSADAHPVGGPDSQQME